MEKLTTHSSFGQGFSEGYASAQTRVQQMEKHLHGLIKELKQIKRKLVLEAYSDIKNDAQSICWSLLRKHLEIHPEDMAEVLADTLRQKTNQKIVVVMNPVFANLARPYLDESICDIETDATIAPGDFEVHSESKKCTLSELIGIKYQEIKAAI